MPTVREIQKRINSVRETQKITNAMYLIASTKLQRARKELDSTRPYFEALLSEIKRVFRVNRNIENRYFYPPGEDDDHKGCYGILAITGDKGLAGSYNYNVVRAVNRLMKEHPDHELFLVGEYGKNYYSSRGFVVKDNFWDASNHPTSYRAREITSTLLERFMQGHIDKIYIVYTDLNKGETKVVTSRMLPFHRANFISPTAAETEAPITGEFEFVPSLEEVLEIAVASYLSGYVYSALVDSFCCEQNARMVAMDNSNRNAQELIDELNIQYNRVRQSLITQEITEVTAGAMAQKRKRKKRKWQKAES